MKQDFLTTEKVAESNKETISRLTKNLKERDDLITQIQEIKNNIAKVCKEHKHLADVNIEKTIRGVSIPVLEEVAILLDERLHKESLYSLMVIKFEGGKIILYSNYKDNN